MNSRARRHEVKSMKGGSFFADPEFVSVLKMVLRDGHVMVLAIKTEK
jgi:hypothetical protein